MNLAETIERNRSYIRTKVGMSVTLCKTDKNFLYWECPLSRARARVAERFDDYLRHSDMPSELIDMILYKWDADVAYDGSNVIKFRVYAPKEYVI